MASEIRVNKIENRSGLGTVTFADTGVDLAGIVTATTFSGSGASLTNVPDSALSAVTASKLSGALPAISAAKIVLPFPTSMRTRPTAVETTGTASDYSVSRTSTYEECNTVPTFAGASKEVGNVNTNQTQASLSTGQSVALRANSTSFYLGFSAEL